MAENGSVYSGYERPAVQYVTGATREGLIWKAEIERSDSCSLEMNKMEIRGF